MLSSRSLLYSIWEVGEPVCLLAYVLARGSDRKGESESSLRPMLSHQCLTETS